MGKKKKNDSLKIFVSPFSDSSVLKKNDVSAESKYLSTRTIQQAIEVPADALGINKICVNSSTLSLNVPCFKEETLVAGTNKKRIMI